VQRPIDAVAAAVLNLQVAQREVKALIDELIERVSRDPFGPSSLPDVRVRLSELRSVVDREVDELIDALARMGDVPPQPDAH
jgi:hypothetical protein